MDSQRKLHDSIDDLFDASLHLEQTHLHEGFDEGYKDGLSSGKEEGRQVGLKLGFETGEELGFYRGCVDVWTSAARIDPTQFSARVHKSIKQMDELIREYPVADPENERIQEIMGSLRLKFRVVCATLSVKLEYKGCPKSSEIKEIEF
ncbi:uncharacterized protein LOC131146618 [Malania oleifera]|uniref:uncharacterized protein LOC131146618 n=1 Tax=Malania oleifera TaxID=397392 RepID=UPI0025AE00BB|nr:uncharacterized protein LOC131146618 [Malania oleifera]